MINIERMAIKRLLYLSVHSDHVFKFKLYALDTLELVLQRVASRLIIHQVFNNLKSSIWLFSYTMWNLS